MVVTKPEAGSGEPNQDIGQGNTRETLAAKTPRGIKPTALKKLTTECGKHDPDPSQVEKPLEMQCWAQSDSTK